LLCKNKKAPRQRRKKAPKKSPAEQRKKEKEKSPKNDYFSSKKVV